MTVNIHNNHNKLSIVGDAKWQVRTVGADRRRGQSSNLGMQKRDKQTHIHFIIIYISSSLSSLSLLQNNLTPCCDHDHLHCYGIDHKHLQRCKRPRENSSQLVIVIIVIVKIIFMILMLRCHEKTTANLVDVPEESCDLQPQETCG